MILTSYVAGYYAPQYYAHCADCDKKLGPYTNKSSIKARCFNCRCAKVVRDSKERGKS